MCYYNQRKKLEKVKKETMKLKEYLQQNGIMQNFFAKKIGVTSNTINKWINEKGYPSLAAAILVEKASNGKVTLYDWDVNLDQKISSKKKKAKS